jgi:hypothetical protein
VGNFDDFLKKDTRQPSGISVEGAFECHHCGVDTNEASFNMETKTLSWVCSECSKTSKIEKFPL